MCSVYPCDITSPTVPLRWEIAMMPHKPPATSGQGTRPSRHPADPHGKRTQGQKSIPRGSQAGAHPQGVFAQCEQSHGPKTQCTQDQPRPQARDLPDTQEARAPPDSPKKVPATRSQGNRTASLWRGAHRGLRDNTPPISPRTTHPNTHYICQI